MSGITKILIQRGDDTTNTAMNVRFTGMVFSSTSESVAFSSPGIFEPGNKPIPFTNTYFDLKSQADLSFETNAPQVVTGEDSMEIFISTGDASTGEQIIWGIVVVNAHANGELTDMSVFDQTTPAIKVLKNDDNWTIQVPPVITKGT
ncbi:MAG: hypothetical protein HEP71_12735 [Roseivirga sp.]|nr:hypothetical protein [Roseivirga sp.]